MEQKVLSQLKEYAQSVHNCALVVREEAARTLEISNDLLKEDREKSNKLWKKFRKQIGESRMMEDMVEDLYLEIELMEDEMRLAL